MKRILLRAGKSPFDVLSAQETLEQRPMGDNIGNYLFAHSAHRMLSTKDTKIDIASLSFKHLDPDYINKHYDAVVLPLANAFRPSAIGYLTRAAKLLEKLKIPVTILSVGLQAPINMKLEDREALDSVVTRFMKAALARGPSVGVRGEYTANYLRELGFKDVEVIGCPSLFMWGPGLKIEKPQKTLDKHSKLAFSANPKDKVFSKTVRHNIDNYRNLTYIPQDLQTMQFMMGDGKPYPKYDKDSAMPFHPKHRVFTEDKARFFTDVKTWLDFQSQQDFVFGDRIHGCVSAILAGTPAFLVAHDSRTLELAEYFDIPHTILKDKSEVLDAAKLYEMTDYTKFNENHAKRFKTFENYLKKHGLEHALYDEKTLAEYDSKLAELVFPDPIHPITAKSAAYRRMQEFYRSLMKVNARLEV